MKTIILSSILALSVTCAAGQSKKDTIRLKADIEAISQGKEVKSNKRQSIVRSRVPKVQVDTVALKTGRRPPTPPNPNNPNPHEPVPSVMNAEPPARAASHPATPAGTPTGAGGPPKKKQ